jgi:hypothetical protein
MGKAFRDRPVNMLPHANNGPTPMIPCRKPPAKPAVRLESGRAMDQRSQQAPQLAATWIVGAITERLASRVKGLTADFCVLLFARKAPESLDLPSTCHLNRHRAHRLRQKVLVQKVLGANA